MTTIVWDGKTLAADRQMGGTANTPRTGNKIVRTWRDGEVFLLAFVGCAAHSIAVQEWWEHGMPSSKFPRPPVEDDPCTMFTIAKSGRVKCYMNYPWPVVLLDEHLVAGSGADLARGALAAGANARQAVEIASLYDQATGMGVDTLEF